MGLGPFTCALSAAPSPMGSKVELDVLVACKLVTARESVTAVTGGAMGSLSSICRLHENTDVHAWAFMDNAHPLHVKFGFK